MHQKTTRLTIQPLLVAMRPIAGLVRDTDVTVFVQIPCGYDESVLHGRPEGGKSTLLSFNVMYYIC